MLLSALVLLLGAAPAAPAAPASLDVPLLRFKWTPEELTTACAAAEKECDTRLAALVAVPDAKRTFKGTFEAYDLVTGDYSEIIARLTFMKNMHTDSKVRTAASECEERAGKYAVALSARRDLYLAMKGYLANAGKKDTLDADQKRLVEITMRDFKRNGLELSDADRATLVSLRSRLTELASRFAKNLNEDTSSITVTKADLPGLPPEFVAAHEDKAKKAWVLTTKYPDYYPVMENCSKESTRRRLELAFMNRGGPENLKLLDEAVALRAQAAHLLGYKTHVDFAAEERMAKNAQTIETFLARMRKGLAPALERETAAMVALKVADTKDKKAVINAWDWRYYMNRIKQRDYAIDDEKVRQYFPNDRVLPGLFKVYSTLLGIELTEVAGAEVWADGVKLYEVRDAGTHKLIARFYMDLYPREGKYGHAAEFGLATGHAVEGGYRIPLAALVVNFQPPRDGKVPHMSLDEVDTLFHEFGHVMHETLTTARYPSIAGTHTTIDFVEAPSQMLQNWVYQPEVLALISSDPADPSKPLPAELAAKLSAARKYNAGVWYSRQVFLGSFDYAIHTADKADSDAVGRTLWAEILKFHEDKDAHFAEGFGHMMNGYDGGYYGYLWSEVFAADMFTRFQKGGVLDPKIGREYRDRVLARGRSVEPDQLLRDFLGREANEEAFLKVLGITSAK